MPILALDVGDRRIGAAISDELGITAQPLETITGSRREALSRIADLCRERDVREIVVGMPVRMDGTKGRQAGKVEAFIHGLREAVPVPITAWDERLTTAAAERTLLEADLSRARRKQVRDQLAAVFILQGYLERRARDRG